MTMQIQRSRDAASLAFEQMNELRLAKQLCDVVLAVGDRQIHAHRFLLAACSTYFRAMFTNNLIESQQHVIKIVDINCDTLEALVNYCYTGTITIDEHNVQLLLPAACLVQMREVQDACCEFLKHQLDTNNCLGIRSFADLHSCSGLYTMAHSFVEENFEKVVESEEFLQLPTPTLIELLECDNLNVRSEETIFNGVIRWTKHDIEARRDVLPQALRLVALVACSAKFLVTTVTNELLIKSNLECRDLVDEAKNQLLVPSERAERRGVRVEPRRSCVYGDFIFAVGGWCSGDAIASVERLDTLTGEWREVEAMNRRRCGVGVATLSGQLYAIGGHDGGKYLRCVERYDPIANRWTNNISNTCKCRTSVGVTVYDNRIFVAGGQDGVSCLNLVECYDAHADKWLIMGSMCTKRLGVSLTAADGSLYAIGGAENQAPLKTVERYDPRVGSWSFVASMRTARKHLGSAFYADSLFAVGGRAEHCELNTCERYNTRADCWEPIVAMNVRRSGVGVAVANNHIYAVGGFDSVNYLNTVEVYDHTSTEQAEWCYASAMNNRRLGGGFGVISITNDQHAALAHADTSTRAAGFDLLQ